MIKKLLAKFIAKQSVVMSKLFMMGDAAWRTSAGTDFAKEAYIRNVIGFRCVNILAQAISAIPLGVKDGGKIQEPSHPLNQLLKRPNPMQGGSDFFEMFAAYRVLDGNSYIEKQVGDITQQPNELWVWMPYQMQVIAKRGERIPRGYLWKDGSTIHEWPIDSDGKSDMLHWKSFHPLNPHYGLSPFSPGAMSVDQHNESSAWNFNLLKNAATPSGLLRSTGAGLSPTQAKNMRKDIDEHQAGVNNVKKIMVLEGKLEYQQMSLSPIDMDFLKGHLNVAAEIAAALGVPLQVIPIEGTQTFKNYPEARLALYEDTALPLLDEMLDELNMWLSPHYGDNVEIFYNENDIPALEIKRSQRMKDFDTVSYLTINEKRKATGYDESDNPAADDLFQDASKFPLGFDVLDEDEQVKLLTNAIMLDHKGLSEDEAKVQAYAIIQSEK